MLHGVTGPTMCQFCHWTMPILPGSKSHSKQWCPGLLMKPLQEHQKFDLFYNRFRLGTKILPQVTQRTIAYKDITSEMYVYSNPRVLNSTFVQVFPTAPLTANDCAMAKYAMTNVLPRHEMYSLQWKQCRQKPFDEHHHRTPNHARSSAWFYYWRTFTKSAKYD